MARYLLIICLLAVNIEVRGAAPIVSDISLVGLELTKPRIVQREIQHSVDVPIDSVQLDIDRDRIENLGLFSLVRWSAYKIAPDTVAVRFYLVEALRFLPGLAPVYDEKTGWSLSGLLIINNFRGLNQSIQLSGVFGGYSSYQVKFSDPWIGGDHISFRTEIEDLSYRHYFLPADEQRRSWKTVIGKRFNYHHHWRGQLKFEQQQFTDKDSTIGRFSFCEPGVRYKFDTRNLYSDPTRGKLISTAVYLGLPLADEMEYYLKLVESANGFKRLSHGEHPLVLAANIRANIRLGFTDELLVRYSGGAYTVRGWAPPDRKTYANSKNGYRFGHQSLGASLELRQTLIPKFLAAPKMEAGLVLVAFADLETISAEINDIFGAAPLAGAGLGLRIPMPMLQQIRLDFGWGYYRGAWRDRQFHLAFGHSF